MEQAEQERREWQRKYREWLMQCVFIDGLSTVSCANQLGSDALSVTRDFDECCALFQPPQRPTRTYRIAILYAKQPTRPAAYDGEPVPTQRATIEIEATDPDHAMDALEAFAAAVKAVFIAAVAIEEVKE
jgi:hypothetical protein